MLFAYSAAAAVVGLIVGGGSLVQPVYGSETPSGGTHFAEVRSDPTASGWSFPMAAEFAPGVPGVCLSFRAGKVDETRELLTAEPPSSTVTDQNPRCGVASPQTRGRLVMLDPATGRALWRRNLAQDLGTSVLSLVWHASRSAGVVVVGVNGASENVLLTLSLRTGKTLSSATVDDPDAVINFAVSGHLVVSVVPDTGGAVDTYTLRRTEALGTRLWQQSDSSVLLPQLLPDRFVLPLPGGTVSVDGLTGRQTAWGADLSALQGVRVTGDRVVAQTMPKGVVRPNSIVMLDAAGKTLWSRAAPRVTSTTVSRRCVLVSSGSKTVTCLDPATGAERWTTSIVGTVIGTPDGSTTGDVEVIGPVHESDVALTVSELDGDSGRVRFSTSVPRGADVVGQAVATGYALGTTSASGAATLTAFDLDSGRTLWSLSRDELGIWGGHPVEITREGVAHELVGGRTTVGHDMLVG